MKAVLKKFWPVLLPVLLTLLTIVSPQVQTLITTVLAPWFAAHPDVAAIVATLVVGIYHALPSPLKK